MSEREEKPPAREPTILRGLFVEPLRDVIRELAQPALELWLGIEWAAGAPTLPSERLTRAHLLGERTLLDDRLIDP